VSFAIGIAVVVAWLAVAVVAAGRLVAVRDPQAAADAGTLVDDDVQRALVARWLARARRARNIGGVCGVVVWLVGTATQGDLLLLGVGGVALGAIAAELHHVTRRRGPRTASLDVRTVGGYLEPGARGLMVFAGAVPAVTAVAATVLGRWSSGAWAMSGVLSLSVVALAQWRVAHRPRPAVGERLRAADDLVRRLAISHGLAVPGSALSLALASHALFQLDSFVAGFAAVAVWAAALSTWWRSRGLRLDPAEVREPIAA
jgi:hypothetical protein